MEKFLKEMTNGEYAIVDSKTVILLDKNADFTVCFTFDPDSDVAELDSDLMILWKQK